MHHMLASQTRDIVMHKPMLCGCLSYLANQYADTEGQDTGQKLSSMVFKQGVHSCALLLI
jgi:hypothetical protein